MSNAKLFVGQIPSVADEQQIRTLFEAFGRVIEVFIIKDKATGMSKGAAFVTFPSKEEADLAIATLHDRHILSPHTHTMQVKYANPSTGTVANSPQLSAATALGWPMVTSFPTDYSPASRYQPQSQTMAPAVGGKGGRKLFVGQIPRAMTQTELLAIMQPFGTVEEVFIMRDKATGESKGAAFVTYTSAAEADMAVRGLDNQRVIPPMKNPMQVKQAEGESASKEPKLFIGMLPYTTTEDELRSLFSVYGQPTEVAIIMKNGSSSGAAFVRYSSTAECEAAMQSLNGFSIDGTARRITVQYAEPRKAPAAINAIQQQQQQQFTLNTAQNQQAMLLQQLLALAQGAGGGLAAALNPQQQQQLLQLAIQQQLGVQAAAIPRAAPIKRNTQRGPPGANLMVTHLPVEYTDNELRQTFEPFGQVVSAHVFVDPATCVSKGFGFVSYNDANTAQYAITAMNGFQIGSQRLKVELKTEKAQPY